MNHVDRMTQAYYQAPWRKQLQIIGIFLLVLIIIALVAGIYLSVTARAATIGRNIQGLRTDIDELERGIADRESQLAVLTSNREMQKRAEEMGFHSVEADEIFYVLVPGYTGRQPVKFETGSTPSLPQVRTLSPDYTQSLFDWLRERVFEPAAPLVEAKP